MRSIFFVSLLAAAVVRAGAQPVAEAHTCALRVQITDEDGGLINKAFVLIHTDRGAKVSRQVVLDQAGKLKINLFPDLYDLFVSSAGFVPVAQILDLRSCKPLNINLMMTIDSEHMEKDQF